MEDTTAEGVQVTVTDETAAEPKPQSDAAILPGNDYDLLLQALKGLKSAIPRRKPAYGGALHDMTDMTALIASKMYAPKVHSPIEGEVRKELRAAKGLLLNRYASFALGMSFISSHNALCPVGKHSLWSSLLPTSLSNPVSWHNNLYLGTCINLHQKLVHRFHLDIFHNRVGSTKRRTIHLKGIMTSKIYTHVTEREMVCTWQSVVRDTRTGVSRK